MRILHEPRPAPIRDDSIFGVAISPDGSLLASAGGYMLPKKGRGEIRLWNLADGSPPVTLHENRNFARCVAFSPDGRYLAAASGDRSIRIWHLPDLKPTVLKGHTRVPTCLIFSPDGQRLASGSANQGAGAVARSGGGEVISWPHPFQQSDWTHPEGGGVWGMCFAANGKSILFGQRSLRTLAVHGTEAREVLPSPKCYVRIVELAPDGATVAACTDKGIVLLEEKTRTVRNVIPKVQRVNCAAFSPDSRILATGHGDGSVRLWNVADGTAAGALNWSFANVRGITFAPNGMTAAACGTGKVNLVVWDAQ